MGCSFQSLKAITDWLTRYTSSYRNQSSEVERVEAQVLTLRSQTVVELENKAARNAQRLAQLQAELALEREEHEAASKAVQEAIMGTLHALADHKEEVKRRLGACVRSPLAGLGWAGLNGWIARSSSGTPVRCACMTHSPHHHHHLLQPPPTQGSSASTACRSVTSSSRSPPPSPRSRSPSRCEGREREAGGFGLGRGERRGWGG